MSRIQFKGNISGTGTVTIESPNTNSDSTVILPTNGGQMIAVDPGTAGNVVTSNGTAWVSQAIPPSDNASNITKGILAVDYGGTGANTAAGALTSLGAYPASNPSGYTTNTGTVTSVNGTGSVNGLTLSGTVTTSGDLTLGGGVNASTISTGVLVAANGGTGINAAGTSGNVLTSNGSAWVSQAPAVPTFLPSGTALLFVQTAAPTGWTKSTAHDNKALRVVSGTAGSGGSVAFTTAFASQTPAGTVSVSVGAGTLGVGIGTLAVGSTTLSTAQMPSHSHTFPRTTGEGGSLGFTNSSFVTIQNYSTSSAGSGNSHNHGLTGSPTISGSPSVTSASFSGSAINLAVAYVDTIIATKD